MRLVTVIASSFRSQPGQMLSPLIYELLDMACTRFRGFYLVHFMLLILHPLKLLQLLLSSYF